MSEERAEQPASPTEIAMKTGMEAPGACGSTGPTPERFTSIQGLQFVPSAGASDGSIAGFGGTPLNRFGPSTHSPGVDDLPNAGPDDPADGP